MKKILFLFLLMFLIGSSNVTAAYRIQGSYTNLENQSVLYSSFEGKIALIEAFSPTCGICKSEHPELEAVYSSYSNKISMISIAIFESDTITSVKDYMKTYPMPWNVGVDSEVLFTTFGWDNTPHIVIVDENGNTLRIWDGFTAFEKISLFLRNLLYNETSTTTEIDHNVINQDSILGDLFGSVVFQAGLAMTVIIMIYFKATGKKNNL